jgi:hypothetical protein
MGSSTTPCVRESPRVRGITKIRGQEKAANFWNALSALKDSVGVKIFFCFKQYFHKYKLSSE